MMKLMTSEVALLKKEQQKCNKKVKMVIEENESWKNENECIKKENKKT